MSKYDELFAEPQARQADAGAGPTPAAATNYDRLFEDPRPGLALRLNADANADQAAKNNALAKRFNLPPSLVETFPEDYRAKAATEDAGEALKAAPRLGSWIAEVPDRAKIAHDDVGTLSGMEQAIRTIRNLPAAAVSAAPHTGGGLWGMAAAPFEVAGQAIGAMGAEGNIVSRFGGALRRQAQSAEDWASYVYTAPADAGIVERGIGSGVQSAAQTVITLPIALRQGGERVALGIMGAVTGGLSYLKGRREGLDPAQAAVYGAQDATAEIVTERLPMLQLVGDLKAGTGAARTVVNFLRKEVPGEIAATVWQNFNEWANVNPDKPIADWLAEQPEAIAETIVATLVGGGAQVGIGKGIQRIMESGDRTASVQRAEQVAAQAEMLSKLGEVSKLKGRDAESFRELVAQIAEEEGEAPTEFYIDGQTLLNTLNQSGISREEIAAIAPVVAAQLDAADVFDVRVPVSEFMAAGEQFTAPLIDHLRSEPDGMTRADRQFMTEHGDTLRADVERELSKMDEQDTFRESIAGVQAQFEGELNTAKRFKPDVNKAYASLLANFYGATAARLGMTPEALLDKYRLRSQAQAQAATGAQTMEQAPVDTPEFRNWFRDSKVADEGGKPLVVYHGTDKDFSAFDPDTVGDNFGVDDDGFFFTSSTIRASGYADPKSEFAAAGMGVQKGDEPRAGANVMPVYLAIKKPLTLEAYTDAFYTNPATEIDEQGVSLTDYFDDNRKSIMDFVKKSGHDGVVFQHKGKTLAVALKPEQIKSAIGNRGTYDPADPSILNQSAAPTREQITELRKREAVLKRLMECI